MGFGYTVKEMIAFTINTILIVILMTVYCQQTGTEATRKRAKAQVEFDAKTLMESLVADLKRATRTSLDFVLLSENPRLVKIQMQIVLDDEKKLVPVSYFWQGTTFSRVMRRKKKVLTQYLQNVFLQSNPNTGEYDIQAIVGIMDKEIVDFPQQTSITDRGRPLDEIPEDITVETEEGLEVDTASGGGGEEDEEDAGRGLIDLYLKYSDYDRFALEKELSNLKLELTRNDEGEKEVNDNLKNDVPGFEREAYNYLMPDIRDPGLLAVAATTKGIDPAYAEQIERKRTLMAFKIELRREIRVVEDVLAQKSKTPIYEGKKIPAE